MISGGAGIGGVVWWMTQMRQVLEQPTYRTCFTLLLVYLLNLRLKKSEKELCRTFANLDVQHDCPHSRFASSLITNRRSHSHYNYQLLTVTTLNIM